MGAPFFSVKVSVKWGELQAPAAVMYQKGDLTWSGAARGRKPKWVIEAQAAGEDIEKYRV
jgi:DNA-binding protein H-NS